MVACSRTNNYQTICPNALYCELKYQDHTGEPEVEFVLTGNDIGYEELTFVGNDIHLTAIFTLTVGRNDKYPFTDFILDGGDTQRVNIATVTNPILRTAV